MLEILKDAIRRQKRLRINYYPGERIIEPHCLGYSKDGNPLVRAFQTEGVSESNEPHDWKLLRVDRLSSIDDEGSGFDGPRPGYKKNDKAMKGGIIAEL